MVPVGFDEGDQRLAGVAEVGDRLAYDDVEHLARFGGQAVVVGLAVGQPEARNLVVQRGIDVKQRAGDVEQRGLVGQPTATDDFIDSIALLQHNPTGDAQVHHAKGVADPGQRLDLRMQLRDVGLAGAQVQVQRILDPQQVFLDRRRHRVEQRTVASAQAAAGMG